MTHEEQDAIVGKLLLKMQETVQDQNKPKGNWYGLFGTAWDITKTLIIVLASGVMIAAVIRFDVNLLKAKVTVEEIKNEKQEYTINEVKTDVSLLKASQVALVDTMKEMRQDIKTLVSRRDR